VVVVVVSVPIVPDGILLFRCSVVLTTKLPGLWWLRINGTGNESGIVNAFVVFIVMITVIKVIVLISVMNNTTKASNVDSEDLLAFGILDLTVNAVKLLLTFSGT
jgi:hypothetical protein